MHKRVVITGMGTINPLGRDVASTWEALIRGVSGVGPVTLFDASQLLVQIACEVKSFDPTDHMEAREARRRDRFEQFASVAAGEAIDQAGLSVDNPSRVGVIVSSAIGGLTTIEESIIISATKDPRRVSPFTIPMLMSNGAAGLIAIDIGARGPAFSVASACASGSDAIGQGAALVRSGVVDAAVVGASEASITRIGIACFDRLGALSRRNDEPDRTPAPFDKERDGLVMGEGAAALVIESLEHASSRGADILAELVGYGSTADAFHVTAPAEDGDGGAAAMRIALESAAISAEQVDYISAHGTGTLLNDQAETKAIKTALGEAAYHVPISSTKSMTGHMMGATGALESIVCVKAILNGQIPPTIHLHTPDPECDLDYVPNQARSATVDIALNNAFGFGGHNAVLAFRRFEG
jgi:beta-ketoacyl-acyl-carrier-protein synthase II